MNNSGNPHTYMQIDTRLAGIVKSIGINSL